MGVLNWLWYLLAGFLLGWVTSTLAEWLWFRQRRLQSGPSRTTPVVADPTEEEEPSVSQERASASGELEPRGETHEGPWRTREGDFYEPYRQSSPSESPNSASTSAESESPATTKLQRPTTVAPADLTAQPAEHPDPLAPIRGLGSIYEERLYEAGIFTWHQLANTDPGTLRAVTQANPSSNPGSWIEQARQLARTNNREGAVYSGPIPDPLTRINGIGDAQEQTLYRAGIYTYRALAQMTPEQLHSVIARSGATRAEHNYRSWIEAARRLS